MIIGIAATPPMKNTECQPNSSMLHEAMNPPGRGAEIVCDEHQPDRGRADLVRHVFRCERDAGRDGAAEADARPKAPDANSSTGNRRYPAPKVNRLKIDGAGDDDISPPQPVAVEAQAHRTDEIAEEVGGQHVMPNATRLTPHSCRIEGAGEGQRLHVVAFDAP